MSKDQKEYGVMIAWVPNNEDKARRSRSEVAKRLCEAVKVSLQRFENRCL